MTATELRAIQHPLKQHYKTDPAAAIVTFHSKAVLGPNITASVESKDATRIAGLHPATGGSGAELCSGDMLLEALVACAAVTLNSVATVMEIQLAHAEVHAIGDLDFRGTLGVDREAPVGFTKIKLSFELKTDAPQEQLEKLLKLTERYCVVFQTLQAPVEITSTVSSV